MHFIHFERSISLRHIVVHAGSFYLQLPRVPQSFDGLGISILSEMSTRGRRRHKAAPLLFLRRAAQGSLRKGSSRAREESSGETS